MQSSLAEIEEIAQFLQDGQALETIHLLQQREQEKEFYMPILGQFSAGKSNLINNLIGRRILPTMLRETTAFTTFLYYGEEEYAEIVTTNKDAYRFAIDKLLLLSQRELNHAQSVSEIIDIPLINNSDILCINVYIQHELFKTGLVFVDTPGLNTIIKEHENHTLDLLPKSHAVLYVLGKSLTAADEQLIRMIQRLGIEMVFVRTKLDSLRKGEGDTIEKVTSEDQLALQKVIGYFPDYYAVTNEEDLLLDVKWSSRMALLQVSLKEDFTKALEQKKQKSIELRLAPYKKSFLENLKQRQQQLLVAKSVADNEIEQKISQLEADMEYVQYRISKQKKSIEDRFSLIEPELKSKYSRFMKEKVQVYEEAIQKYSRVEQLTEKAQAEGYAILDNVSKELSSMTNERLSKFLKVITEETNADLKDNKHEQFELDGIDKISLQVEVPSVDYVFSEGEYIQSKIEDEMNYANQLILELEELKKKQQNMEGLESQYAEEIVTYQQQLDELGPYQAQYTLEQSIENQERMRKIGNIVDWALVFIPGKAYTTMAGKVAGTLKKVDKASKYYNIAQKTISSVEKAGKILSKTDKLRDGLKVAQSVQENLDNHQSNIKDKTNILDLISLEYWFGQVGRMMDGPPKEVIDVEYERQYREVESEVKARFEQAKQKELLRHEQLGLLKSHKERIQKELEIQQRQHEQLQQELEEAKQRSEQYALKQTVVVYRKQLVASFEEQVQQLFKRYSEFLHSYLQRFIGHVPNVIAMQLQQQLFVQKQQLQELLTQRQQGAEQQQQYEAQLNDYLQFISEPVAIK
ncbi:dynamin family protein [Bacillus sp. FJAT-42315]|uniref:dynamin family protein n=1 Tax=Bacillus sp. FJAT-42315 TaxID=2014077 RepID=UPI000C24A179|nr:dynamin family protein [Bacillus sp. FJAT-42315]